MTAHSTRFATRIVLLAAMTASLLVAVPMAQAPQVGPNVNIIGGPAKIVKGADGKYQLLEGDPGQRQNEVSCFVDSRDPLDIGCAYNDYTPVEIAGLNGDKETGDAWIGRSVSIDGGMTWRKYMLPGYPQDGSPAGQNSPLRQLGLEAAADANWVGGPFGTSYLTAIAFKRSAIPQNTTGTGNDSVVFVQKYVNRNNVENDPDPFKPEGPPLILTAGMGMKFHDKPVSTVSSLGSLHLVWAVFPQAPAAPTQSEIWHAICPLGDLTRCIRTKISSGAEVFNGATLTIHPTTLWRDITYRRHGSDGVGGTTDAIMFVRCLPEKLDEDNLLGKCGKPVVISAPPDLQRTGDGSTIGALFDQGSSTGTFRNLSNPTIAADGSKRVYIAWAQRLPGTDTTDPTMPLPIRDSRIILSVGHTNSKGNVSFGAPVTLNSLTGMATRPTGRGHEIRPQMWFGAGKLYVSAAVLHQDQTLAVYDLEEAPDPGKLGGKILKYVQSREYKGELDPSPPKSDQIARTFTEFVVDAVPALPLSDVLPTFVGGLKRRHTQEIGLWSGTPAPSGSTAPPAFTFTNVWRSRIGLNKTTGRYEQIDFNAWGINMFDKGRIAFAGDYDAVMTQAFVPTSIGIGFLPNIAPRPFEPVFVAWTDNRNVRTYVPPEFYTPAGTPLCSPQNPNAALTRNQDIYMARTGQGLYMYAFGNQKPLGDATLPNVGSFQIKRSYLLQLQNALNATKHYRIVIANQPPGGSASLKQFGPVVTQLDVSIPPFSIIAREAYVKSSDRNATVRINAFEITQPGGSLVNGGLQALVLLNPDRFAPGLQPPIQGDVDPTDPRNSEIFSPDPLSPDPLSSNVDVTPDPLSPDPLSPDPLSPDPLSPDPLSPDPLSPDPLSPDPLSPDPLSPDPLSPDPLSVPANGVMTDTVVEVQNGSNTSSAMAIKTLTTRPLPPGSRLQTIILQPYFTTTQRDCNLLPENASIPLVTVTDPELLTNTSDLTFDPTNASVKNITVGTRPGSKIYVVYRWVDPDKSDNVVTIDQFGRRHSVDPDFNPAADLITVPISQPISTPEAIVIEAGCGGVEQPPCPTSDDPRIPLSITTTSLPTSDIGQTYPNTQLTAIGGVPAIEGPAYSWSATGLPTGLTLSSGGVLSGTPTALGIFPVTVTATDSRTPEPTSANRSFRLTILPRANLVGIKTPEDTPTTNSPGDSGGQPFTINVITAPTHGTVSSITQETGTFLRYAPASNYFGPDSFVYSITAAGLTSNPSTVAVVVDPVNDVPVAVNDTATTTTNVPVNVNVLANDTDVENNTLVVTGVGTPTSGTAQLGDDQSILYTPAAGFTGPASFTYTISDGLATATGTVDVTVNAGSGAAPTALIDCSVAAPSGGDLLERGFYVPSYPGINLRRVDLWLSSGVAGDYQFNLTARAGSYAGTQIAQRQVTVTLNGDALKNTLTTFDFSDGDFAPAVTPGTLVTFSITQLSGPTNSVFYSVASPAGCPIEQTNGTTPPLDTPRRDGVTARIFGDEPVLLFGVNSANDGLSVINPTTGVSTFRGALGATSQYETPVAAAVRPSDDVLYVWNNSGTPPAGAGTSAGVLLAVDPCTARGTPVDEAAPAQGQFGGLAFVPSGDALFGAGLVSGSDALFRINANTGVKQQVGTPWGFQVGGLAFDSGGTLYALSLNGVTLHTIDTATGAIISSRPLVLASGAPAAVGVAGSLTLSPGGTLIGSADDGNPGGEKLFDITPGATTAVVSNVRAVTGNGGVPQGMDFAPGCPNMLLIRTKALPTGLNLIAYRAVLRAAGGQGTVTWSIDSVSGLPDGLTLSPSGVISGTPSATAATSTFTVKALEASGRFDLQTYTIVIGTP